MRKARLPSKQKTILKTKQMCIRDSSRHEAFAEDAFKYLDRMGDQYDLIILDPPAFAKHKDALRNACLLYTSRCV